MFPVRLFHELGWLRVSAPPAKRAKRHERAFSGQGAMHKYSWAERLHVEPNTGLLAADIAKVSLITARRPAAMRASICRAACCERDAE